MFHCSKCDSQSLKWSGKCNECQSWGTITQEEEASTSSSFGSIKKAKALESTPLSKLSNQNEHERYQTKNPEVDRVLGDGLVKGSLVLLSGEPGIGKSTLIASMSSDYGSSGNSILYISGEESSSQLKTRFTRLKSDTKNINFLEMVSLEQIVSTIEKESPSVVVIDSIQTVHSASVESTQGSPTTVRYAASVFMELAKRTGTSIVLIGQVTKDGSVAGPKTLEHIVDVVVSLEGDASHTYRILEAKKNRFGATDEIGVLEMTGIGLIPVENPSAKFLEERASVPGSVVATVKEGSRVFLVEVQALVEKAFYGTPVRRANGIDQNRLQMLVAILSKRAGLKLGESDVFVNVVGGMQLKEPAADLAICAAIISAVKNTASANPIVYIGEVGLGGEVRSVPMIEKRITEVSRVGISHVIIPNKKTSTSNVEVKRVSNVKELV
jgi:DNA repair protein RadA/Sms